MMETRIARGADGGELPLLVSPIIPARFRHGFTTRAGGASRPPFDSLNLGWRWGDGAEAVAENHRRLLAVSGATAVLRVSQVHGTRILRARGTDAPGLVAAEAADGLATDEPGVGLSVHVADCTPILVACGRTGACAALHAGWRGTVLGMAVEAVQTMRAHFGCQPSDLRVALGPCIGACCFAVGPEVVAAFASAMPAARDNGVIVSPTGTQEHIDLRRFQRLQFEAAGVPPENIDVSADCTFCDPRGRFFSYRRAGRATGQSVGFVVRAF
ncbi:MAG: peptidoglycan editing factor PgeF [Deltaproteobacteria bacterium]|nr:peptidoglycan editing factor PgeF [Deltaproteobacteria bacterium]